MKTHPRFRDFGILVFFYLLGLSLRLIPRLLHDPHLLVFDADIWYRLCLAQYVLDHGHLPVSDIRYLAYGHVPFWYNPLAVYFFAGLSRLSSLDLPTVTSRLLPFFESLVIVPFYVMCRGLYNRRVAVAASLFLSLTPNFVYWTGIATPQSFTLFIIPIIILAWVRYEEGTCWGGSRGIHLTMMGCLLAVNFLFHLTFFNLVIIWLLVQAALVREGRGRRKDFLVMLVPLALSQVLTAWWWAPENLYWWWTRALSTSSQLFEGQLFLKHYGEISAVLGHAAFLYVAWLLVRRRRSLPPYYYLPVFWALFPLAESHMEGLIHLLRRPELVWHNLLRPIEGFRFYSFLAQPFAVCLALALESIQTRRSQGEGATSGIARHRIVVAAVSAGLLVNLVFGYGIFTRLTRHLLKVEDIEAARWFRAHSGSQGRMLADYYTAQMVSGICGGKALLGAMFPLKNTSLPYINNSWKVLDDIYSVYTSDDPGLVQAVLARYGCTHVYVSPSTLRYIEYVYAGEGDRDKLLRGGYDRLVGRDLSAALLNRQYFEPVYEAGDIKILRWNKTPHQP